MRTEGEIAKYWLEFNGSDFYIGEIEILGHEDEDDAFPRFLIEWPYFLHNFKGRLNKKDFSDASWEAIEIFSNYPEIKDPSKMEEHALFYQKNFNLIIDIGFKLKTEINNEWSYLMYKPEDDDLYIGRESTLKYFGIEFKPAA